MANFIERDERCVFVGNLEPRVTEEIIWELFLQVSETSVLLRRDKHVVIFERRRKTSGKRYCDQLPLRGSTCLNR